MPLVSSTLADGLSRVHRFPPPGLNQTLGKIVDAYERYARAATAGGIPVVLLGTEKTAMRASLQAAFQEPRAGTPSLAAAQWDQGVLAFWTATPPGVLFPTAIALAYVPGPLQLCLTPVFSNQANSATSAASQMASCLDTATRTVAVTLPGPTVVTLV